MSCASRFCVAEGAVWRFWLPHCACAGAWPNLFCVCISCETGSLPRDKTLAGLPKVCEHEMSSVAADPQKSPDTTFSTSKYSALTLILPEQPSKNKLMDHRQANATVVNTPALLEQLPDATGQERPRHWLRRRAQQAPVCRAWRAHVRPMQAESCGSKICNLTPMKSAPSRAA